MEDQGGQMAPQDAKRVPKGSPKASAIEQKMLQNLGLVKMLKLQPLQWKTAVFEALSHPKMGKKLIKKLT